MTDVLPTAGLPSVSVSFRPCRVVTVLRPFVRRPPVRPTEWAGPWTQAGMVDARSLLTGLKIPPGCELVVGGEPQCWAEGHCLLVDDSFLHTVAHNGNRTHIRVGQGAKGLWESSPSSLNSTALGKPQLLNHLWGICLLYRVIAYGLGP